MLSMLMHGQMNEFFDPSLDPSNLPPLTPSALSIEACSPTSIIPDPMDAWAASHMSYLDFSPTGHHTSNPFDPQLTPSLSTPAMSASGSSVSSTPQLSDPHFGGMQRFVGEPQIAIAQYSGLHDMHYLPHGIEANDPRLGPYALCDSREFSHGLSTMLGHTMAATA